MWNLSDLKSIKVYRRRFNAAATPRLGSTQLGLNKHYAAVIINNEMKTKISKFPRSNPNHFYGFQRFEIITKKKRFSKIQQRNKIKCLQMS